MRALPATVLAVVVLLWNVHHGLQRHASHLPDFPGRYFADVSIATHLFLRGEYPVASYRVRRAAVNPQGDEAFSRYVRELDEATAAAGITSARPFRIVAAHGGGDNPIFVRRRDDSGRAFLLGYAFRALGGVAPYLLFWLAPILAAAVLCWIAFEAAAAGWALAGQVFILLVACSAYATDLLGLAYSPAGFYLVGVMALVAHALYACRPDASPAGVLWRTAASGAVIAVCALCRSGTLVLVPFFLGAAMVGLRRQPWPAATRKAVLAAAVLIGPYLAAASITSHVAARTAATYSAEPEPQDHDIWISIWEGLGDFDRTHGYVWDDIDAQVAVGNERLGTLGSAAILRGQVLHGIRSDPLWYAGVLVKRTMATLTQWKLLPWAPLGGRSMRPRSSYNEGAIDSYYALTSALDWFRIGPWLFEVPVPVFWIAVVAAIAVAFRRPRPETRATALVLGILLVATLALPVAVTTAGALETQAIAIPYFLALGVMADLGLRARRIMT